MPPTNHFAWGGFQSSTFFQGVNQVTFSLAIFAQKRSGFLVPSSRYSATFFLFQFACLAKSRSGLKVRFSFNNDSMLAMGSVPGKLKVDVEGGSVCVEFEARVGRRVRYRD